MAESKWEKYVIRHTMDIDPARYNVPGGGTIKPPNRFLEGPAASQVPSNNLVEFYWVTEDRAAGVEGPRGGPQEHYFDEIFCWIGTNPDNLDDLGGDVEFWMGWGDDLEKIHLNTSSCIYCPGNVPHMPIFYRNVKKPFLCMVIGTNITVVNGMTTKRYGPDVLKGLI